jgi:HTH-type transcriptional regulator / antitoxin HipB
MPFSKENRQNLPIESSHALGQILRNRRIAMGLTQPQLALAAGCGTRFIVDLEAGKPTVRLENVLRVIDALGARITLGDAKEQGHG